MNGIDTERFDEMDYFELLEGMNAKAPEDRPVDLETFLQGI